MTERDASSTDGAEASHSLWMDLKLPSYPSLENNLSADVCIVGAGIVGLMCAYTLLKEGKSVVVLDQGAIANGQSAHTTAHLTWVLDDRFYKLEQLFGQENASIAAKSHSAAIDYIEKIVSEEKISCDFERVDGYLFVPPQDSQEVLDKEYGTIQSIGMEVHKVSRAPFNSNFETGPCLRFPQQAQFHVLKYLQGLIKAILRLGGKIFSHSRVNSFKDGSPCIAKTDSGFSVSAQSIIVATCTPVNNRFFIHSKQAPYRTYVVAASIPKSAVVKALYWDTAHPYHYIRIQSSEANDWLIVGGEDHKTGQDADITARYQALESWTKKRFPMVGQFEYRWSGQVFEPIDSLAFIGRNPGDKNIYIATGDSGNGMTHASIAGILLPDLILGKDNSWKDLYEPSRKTLSAAATFIQENLNVAAQYRDWFTAGEAKKIEDLIPEEGLVVRKGLKKMAVYKDSHSNIHINSACCPHLGGCVRWNKGEKCWDCPCHGSSFDGQGNVISGPAKDNLSPY